MNEEKKRKVDLFPSWDLLCLENGVHTSPRVVLTLQDTLEPRIYCEYYHIVYALFASRKEGQREHLKELMSNLENCVGS